MGKIESLVGVATPDRRKSVNCGAKKLASNCKLRFNKVR